MWQGQFSCCRPFLATVCFKHRIAATLRCQSNWRKRSQRYLNPNQAAYLPDEPYAQVLLEYTCFNIPAALAERLRFLLSSPVLRMLNAATITTSSKKVNRFLALLALAFFAVFGSSALNATVVVNARAVAAVPAMAGSLSPGERVKLFEEVWKAINERYYDPTFNGVNWKKVHDKYRPEVDRVTSDEELYSLLNRMLGELRDAHTRLFTPRERDERRRLQAISLGLSVYEVEGKTVVTSVEPDSEAARAGIEPGMIVQTIDNKPLAERIAEVRTRMGGTSTDRALLLRLYRLLLDGEPGSSLRLGLARADGKQINIVLTRRIVSDAPRIIYRRLPSGYGYIKLNVWKSPIHEQFKRALQELKDAPGMIIDLRGNPGGEVNEILKIAGYFFSSKMPFGRFITRTGRPLELFSAHHSDMIYSGPVAILVNEGSGSGSEMFSGVLQESGRAIVIGRQSCGCLLGITEYRKVRGGGELAISELGYISPKGRRLEGVGVIPNELVELKLSDLQSRRDIALEEAEAALRVPLKASSSAQH
jgi:carboxyl-terminal processing protease